MNLFKIKVAKMSDHSKLCAIVFDEISLKESVHYDVKNDELEGLEHFGHLGRSKYVANHALVFIVKGLIDKWKQPFALFVERYCHSIDFEGIVLILYKQTCSVWFE